MLINVVKRFLPQSIQRRLHDAIYRRLRLTYRLDSNVAIWVESRTDWLVYNDIFLNREYDDAIGPLLGRRDSGACVLDLGCNSGFFTLRCLDLLGPDRFKRDFRWVCVDASAETLELYKRRVLEGNQLNGQVDVVQGLVGERSGSACFYESTNHGNNTRITRKLEGGRRYTRNDVRFVDLNLLVPSGAIALVKCDIEGSEAEFIANYGALIERADALVFEFHDGIYDRRDLIEKVRAHGHGHRTLRERPGTSLEYFFKL